MQQLRYSKYFRWIFIALDLVVLCAVLLFFNNKEDFFSENSFFVIVLLGLLWALISSRTRLYDIKRTLTYTSFLERLFIQLVFFSFAVLLLSKISARENISFAKWQALFAFCIIIFWLKSVVFFFVKWIRTMGYNQRNIMFLENDGASGILRNTLSKRKDYGFRIFDFKENIKIKSLEDFWKENGIHTIYVPLQPKTPPDLLQQILYLAEKDHVRVSFVPDVITDDFTSYELSYAETQPVFVKSRYPLQFWGNSFMKRTADIVFSLFFLVFVGSWLFPVLSVLIKTDSRGPVFFKQKRYGQYDRIFGCLKFRTMIPNDASNRKTTEKGDARITRIGNFLRKTSLDETPQFINVLLGDMSVVGPRPHMLSVDDHYREFITRYNIRNTVKPGITGLAQVNGLRGDTDEMDEMMQKRVMADAFYVKNWSFSMDVVIILKTVFLLIRGDKKAF